MFDFLTSLFNGGGGPAAGAGAFGQIDPMSPDIAPDIDNSKFFGINGPIQQGGNPMAPNVGPNIGGQDFFKSRLPTFAQPQNALPMPPGSPAVATDRPAPPPGVPMPPPRPAGLGAGSPMNITPQTSPGTTSPNGVPSWAPENAYRHGNGVFVDDELGGMRQIGSRDDKGGLFANLFGNSATEQRGGRPGFPVPGSESMAEGGVGSNNPWQYMSGSPAFNFFNMLSGGEFGRRIGVDPNASQATQNQFNQRSPLENLFAMLKNARNA